MSEPPSRCALPALRPRWATVLLFVLGTFLILRLTGFVWLMSVNVPFSDQWSILRALEDGFQWSDVRTAFFWQHGPHRQGLSFAWVLPAYHFSHWSVRLDSLMMVGEQLLAGLLALRLRRRLLPGGWWGGDAALMLLFWGVCTFETLVVAPNASHSIFPLWLLLALANVWLWPYGFARLALLSVLIVGLTFTGFGITAIPAILVVLSLEAWRNNGAARTHALMLLGVCALSLIGFLHDYHFVVAADGFEVMRPNPVDYLQFVVAMYSHFLLMLHRAPLWARYPAGLAAVLGMALVAWSAFRTVVARANAEGESDRQHLAAVSLILIGCSLAFALLTAYGRVQLGMDAATASRYTALLMPGVAVLLLWLLRDARLRPLLMAVLLLLAARTVPETRQAWIQARYYASMKLCWLENYRETRDFDLASERVASQDGFHTFQPVWMGEPGTWQMLAEQGLGPFAAGAAKSPFLRIYPHPCEVLRAP